MLLFVYGTMMHLGRNYPRLYEQGAVRVDNDCGNDWLTEDKFDLYVGHQNKAPLAVRSPITGLPVGGELYAIEDEKVRQHIDPCEGHPNTYRREPVHVMTPEGKTLPVAVWMYVYRAPLLLPDRRVLSDGGVLRFDELLVA